MTNSENNGQIILYCIDNQKEYVNVVFKDETFWLTQKAMAELFDVNPQAMSAKDKSFKNWSNNVYSFVLPVPASRHETPNICIEHLYTDTEIKTEVEENGILRRLYIGNEFDSRGLATKIDRICEKAKKCGPESIDIIEGSKGEKVTAISDSEGKTNYALPKTSFAKYVSENSDKFNFDNFAEIFKIIKAIIEDGETPCQNNQQQ